MFVRTNIKDMAPVTVEVKDAEVSTYLSSLDMAKVESYTVSSVPFLDELPKGFFLQKMVQRLDSIPEADKKAYVTTAAELQGILSETTPRASVYIGQQPDLQEGYVTVKIDLQLTLERNLL